MRKKVFAKSVSVAALVLGLSANSYAADEKSPAEEKPVDSLLGMFQEGTVKGKFRAFYGDRNFDKDTPDRRTLAIGGHLHYETAPLAGISLGVDFKTTQGAGWQDDDYAAYVPLFPKDADGKNENINALDEYYLKYSGYDTTVTVGAQYLNTPAMRGHRIRILDKKYLGIGVVNKSIEKVELYGYYIDQYMGWFEEDFNSVSSAWTRNTDDDEGAFVGGVIWRAPGTLQLQAWDYYFPEVLNQYYFRGRYNFDITDDLNMSFDLRYLGLKDIGDALGGAIDTYNTGAIVGLKGYGVSLTGHILTNGDDRVPDPFDAPLVLLMQGRISNDAELNAWALKLGYDFGEIGVKGLSTYVFYGQFDTPDDGDNASPDSNEIDFNVSYRLQGWAKGIGLRARYAMVDQDEAAGGEDFNDFRLYLDFNF